MALYEQKKKDILQASKKAKDVAEQATSMDSRYDPQGSYTGQPVSGDRPTQDADDLA